MKIQVLTTLRGRDTRGDIVHWPKNFIFDDDIAPIPQTIIDELVLKAGTVEEITPNKIGGRPSSSPPNIKASSPSSDKKKAKKTVKKAKKSASKKKRI